MTDPQPPRTASEKRWGSADHIGGLIWLVFGGAVLYGSWTMDRLANQNVNPVTVPGLVPGLVGAGIMIFALVLLFRRNKPQLVGVEETEPTHMRGEAEAEQPANWGRVLLSWALCVGFAGALLGRGLPFWLLAGGFVFIHILLLDDPDRIAEQPLARRVITAAIVAVCTAAVVTFVFQKIFLVRLP